MKKYRILLYLGSCAALFAVNTTIVFAQKLPPNRGNLTVAEFAENYNYYSNYYGIEFGNEYLDDNCEWAEKVSEQYSNTNFSMKKVS